MGRKQKIYKRLRASKARLMEGSIIERCDRLNKKIKLSTKGFEYRIEKKKNAFLHPEDPNSEFPQREPEKIIDFRSSQNPFSGMEQRGIMRNKTKTNDTLYARMVGEETDEMKELKNLKKIDVKVNQEEIMNDLINMKVFTQHDRKVYQSKKRVIRKTKWKKKACKKSRRLITFN